MYIWVTPFVRTLRSPFLSPVTALISQSSFYFFFYFDICRFTQNKKVYIDEYFRAD